MVILKIELINLNILKSILVGIFIFLFLSCSINYPFKATQGRQTYLIFEDPDSNLDDLFRALGWRRLYYQRLEQKSILMYKT